MPISAGLQVAIVDVAPLPVFAFFGGLDYGVLSFVEMGAGVAAWGRVAAAYVAAFEAHAEMKPFGAGFETFLATLGLGLHFFDVVGGVGTGCGHGWPPGDGLL
jgi:hypothetical protein